MFATTAMRTLNVTLWGQTIDRIKLRQNSS